MKIFDFFRTAPKIKSDKVLMIEKAGLMHLLIKAIEAERSGSNDFEGLGIKVKKV